MWGHPGESSPGSPGPGRRGPASSVPGAGLPGAESLSGRGDGCRTLTSLCAGAAGSGSTEDERPAVPTPGIAPKPKAGSWAPRSPALPAPSWALLGLDGMSRAAAQPPGSLRVGGRGVPAAGVGMTAGPSWPGEGSRLWRSASRRGRGR